MYMHIQQHSGKFRVFGDRLHLGAISIPFKQVTARMKLISFRLLRMQCIPEAVFHCSLISQFFGKVYEFNADRERVIKAIGDFQANLLTSVFINQNSEYF